MDNKHRTKKDIKGNKENCIHVYIYKIYKMYTKVNYSVTKRGGVKIYIFIYLSMYNIYTYKYIYINISLYVQHCSSSTMI